MDGVRLLARARAAGLVVRLDGERIVVRGNRHLGGLATEVLSQKAAVVTALRAEVGVTTASRDVVEAVFPGATVVEGASVEPLLGATTVSLVGGGDCWATMRVLEEAAECGLTIEVIGTRRLRVRGPLAQRDLAERVIAHADE